ncbi:hypothetical protein D5b_00186 [Faustovirus]|nr:hypothetical protein D5b_00186 [Faustovirus]AMN84727.1 hypothetical protein D6_00325 [Faustovirus]AMP44140.1 hypothetical protein PRJ_Dakar_00184 [Faustovirus]QKE50412.1 hypothetical protein F-VV10_0292 [Faustovirus]
MIALQGVSGIVNKEFIRSDINIEDLEKQLVNNGTIVKSTERDPNDRFKEEASEIARKHGIDLSGILDTGRPSVSAAKPNTAPQPNFTSFTAPSYQPSAAQSTYDVDESSDTNDDNDSTGDSGKEYIGHMDSNIGSSRVDTGDSRYNTPMNSFGADLSTRTAEQERRSHISSVLHEISHNPSQNYSFENEKRNDLKRAMLDEIAYLREVLSDEKVNIEHVESVTSSDSFEKIENVLKILQHMNDRNRYCNMAEEGMLMMAHGFGELFDGKRSFFGIRPDLRGWHNHLNVKLKRMRYDTSRFVGNIMQDYNIGPGWRILLEVIPNLIIYSQSKKKHHTAPDSLYSDNDIDDVTRRLNNLH